MSDPQNPASTPDPDGSTTPPSGGSSTPPPVAPTPASSTPPPASSTPPAYEAPAYPAAPQYTSAPQYTPGQGAPGEAVPGKTMGIVAFVLSFFAAPVGLILGIVALVQSKKAGVKNGFALAAIIISSVAIVLTVIIVVIVFATIGAASTDLYDQYLMNCGPGGSGYVEILGERIPCEQIDTGDLD